MRTLEPEAINKGRKKPGVIGHAKRIGWVRRAAAARRIPRDHVEFVGEILELTAPNAAIAEETVKENQGWSLAGPLIGDAKPLDLGLAHVVQRWRLRTTTGIRRSVRVW